VCPWRGLRGWAPADAVRGGVDALGFIRELPLHREGDGLGQELVEVKVGPVTVVLAGKLPAA